MIGMSFLKRNHHKKHSDSFHPSLERVRKSCVIPNDYIMIEFRYKFHSVNVTIGREANVKSNSITHVVSLLGTNKNLLFSIRVTDH